MLKPQEMAWDDFFAAVADIGYAAVEFWGMEKDFPAVIEKAHKRGLAVSGFIGVSSLENGLNNPKNHEQIESELKSSIDFAAEHGIPGLICFSGNRMPALSDEQGAANTTAGLKRIAPYAEKKGVTLNLELLNSKINHPNYMCDHTEWAADVVRNVASTRVKMLYDIYHMQVMEGDVIHTITDNIDHIGHFHTAGVPGRYDPDETQELYYPAVAKAIAATDYAGFVCHEFMAKGDKIEALKNAFQTCNF